ncbi:hypothetical protein LTR84_006236 [Exophiala bonariae]|uniref:Kinetochore protein fta4 n=1 Tax=Exophiala bonariae TaxID=1690606 RepID=A0AAV9N563_9EURO|nr:hypothetical protein LTR84_006236 [Exophiala bonariae]
MEEDSITATKAAFIRSQLKYLSAPLQPSTAWRDFAPEPGDGQLNDKAIQDIVSKVDDKIKAHHRMIFSTQSQRHIAEQIEALYWNKATAEQDRAEIDTVAIRREVDLTETATIESLPEDYTELHLHQDYKVQDDEASEYLELRGQLVEMALKRDALKRRVAQYQQLQKALDPLQDPVANIQPNLVSRDGELSQELDRMRVLMARVSAGLADLDSRPVDKDLKQSSTESTTNAQKLARLLERT